jgi:hypothetical protein
MLTEPDKARYRELQQQIRLLSCRTKRIPASCKSHMIFSRIKQFAIRHDSEDWKRCAVCGIAWLDGAIAINPHQLSITTGKCKSSVNAGLQTLGYAKGSWSVDHALALANFFPLFGRNPREVRQWTVRERCMGAATAPRFTVQPRTAPCAEVPVTIPCDYNGTPLDLEDFGFQDDSDDSKDYMGCFA